MKILSAPQIREADQYTIQNEPIASIALMERAAQKVVEILVNEYQSTQRIKHIFCGTGNNGGDGLAVARLLYHQQHAVKVYLLEGNPSKDYSVNLQKLREIQQIEIVELKEPSQLNDFHPSDIIVDAIFGTGLNKPLEGNIKDIIDHLNDVEVTKISIDIPSGLFADQPNQLEDTIFKSDRVYTFHAPKLSFLLPENGEFVKTFKVLDIRLAPEFTENTDSKFYYLQKKDIQERYRPRKKFSHKGTYGHSLLIAGSKGKMGAAVLSAKAILRTGAGLLTTHIPHDQLNIMQTALPEAMCSLDSNNQCWSELPDTRNKTIGVGPGIGTSIASQAVLRQLLLKESRPMVLDADAINLISFDQTMIRLIPIGSIITPHPKEFERLIEGWNDDFDRLELQRQFSIKHQLIVVLKDAHTSISDSEGNIYFNSTGNSGMATGGSGDVLTGIITSLLTQGYSSIDAAIIGVYIHGLSGNLSLEEESKESLIASDIIKNLGKAFKAL